MERRNVRRRVEPNPEVQVETLQTMPSDIQRKILKTVCENGFGDFWRAKSTCKALRDASDTPAFHREVDVYIMQAPDFPDDGVKRFKNRCVHRGSPSANFTEGIFLFFKEGELEQGLEDLRLSALGKYELGIYAYAMIHRIMNPHVEIVDEMGPVMRLATKDFIRKMRKEVNLLPDIAWPMFDTRPQLYDEMVAQIPEQVVYNCRCSQNSRFARAWFEEVKEGAMCDRCFWICQSLWFSREFPKKVLNWPEEHLIMNRRIRF